jgi:hypothetical protein
MNRVLLISEWILNIRLLKGLKVDTIDLMIYFKVLNNHQPIKRINQELKLQLISQVKEI